MKRLLIKNALIVNEGRTEPGAVVINGDTIEHVLKSGGESDFDAVDIECIDAGGAYLMPGVIDEHVHFREPGLTAKADISSETRAAAAGGVTSFFDMPNTNPTTTTIEAHEEKMRIASGKSLINYNFFFGATNNNAHLLPSLDKRKVCGVKLFMGASTGNMLVDEESALHEVFAHSPLPIMTHCEYSPLISQNMAAAKEKFGTDDPDIAQHPVIRSEEACYRSSSLAVELARKTGAKLHVAHLTTARELELFSPDDERIIAEVCLPHLLFSDADYSTLGSLIKCNPAIKTAADRDALRKALTDGRIRTIGTDHAPHQPSDKVGGAAKAASGIPMVQFSLVSMLDLAAQGVLSVERVVELMCHNPAKFYDVERRGFIAPGYKADLTIVRHIPQGYTLAEADVISKCGWSPLVGRTMHHRVETTICGGTVIYDKGAFPNPEYRGEAITFAR